MAKAHTQLIRNLLAEIRRLRAENDSLVYQMEESEYGYSNQVSHYQEQARRASNAAREAEQEASNARYNQERMSDIASQIERAQRYGEDYKVQRLTREMNQYR